MKYKTIASLAALFVAGCVALLLLNYSSPTGTRTLSSVGLRTGNPSCSTMVTIPLVGSAYLKPDSIIFQMSVRAPAPHPAPSCSVFARGTYGSYITTDWTPWAFIRKVDSGATWFEIGRPYASFDFLWLKVKLAAGDTAVVNLTCKYLGEIPMPESLLASIDVKTAVHETITVTPPFPETLYNVGPETIYTLPAARETIVVYKGYQDTIHVNVLPTWSHRTINTACTLDNTTDFYTLHPTAGGPPTIWLPRAVNRSRPIYIACDTNPIVTINLNCQAGDSFFNKATSVLGFARAGSARVVYGNNAHKWAFVRDSL
jgi:hypothetical protein